MAIKLKNQSHKTAIRRNKISSPAKCLLESGLLVGSILDFGCGKGDDIKALSDLGFKVSGFDPYWRPNKTTLNKKWDTILCSYVFNVVGEKERVKIIKQLKRLRSSSGKIYITVRKDIKKTHTTKNKTTQYKVELPFKKVIEKGWFCTYELS